AVCHRRRLFPDPGLELGDLLPDLLANLRRRLADLVLRRCRLVHHRLAVLLPPLAYLLAAASTILRIEEVDERSTDHCAHQHPGTKHEVILLLKPALKTALHSAYLIPLRLVLQASRTTTLTTLP